MQTYQPLASKLRPKKLSDFIGQEHLVAQGMPLHAFLEKKQLPSIILWGPPGCGKTTIARILCNDIGANFVELSAVSAKKEDIDRVINQARLHQEKTVLFLDEIHRFNKAQQDYLLPFVESGTITLIGATTENPSFEVISALLSRTRVFIFKQLQIEHLIQIITNAIQQLHVIASSEAITQIAHYANGDARSALTLLETAMMLSGDEGITKQILSDAAQKAQLYYDKSGEEHYNIISALHKSIRSSDVDAAVYWTMRMVNAGEDPKYIVRRMIRMASEDIGLADPRALILAISVKEAVIFLGYPECNTALVELAIYLATAPKSNAVYVATNLASEEIAQSGNLPVPIHLRNAPTKFMKDIGYGDGYKYAHDYINAKVDQQHLPDAIKDKKFYTPIRGFESKFKEE